MPPKDDITKYKKHELRDHIYELPDTYIGSVDPAQIETYLYDPAEVKMVKQTITYIPGLYKIFDEVAVNALDHIMRLMDEASKGKEDVRHVKNIRFKVDIETGWIEIFNDGDGIDVELHPDHNVYIPHLVYGFLLTSANYDKDVEKLWGGKNGYGGKLTNIFSKELKLETVDHRRKKMFTQTFRDNMKVAEKPSVKACAKAPYTKISFLPDYERFGMQGLSKDMYDLFMKRAVDACASSAAHVNVYFNDEQLKIKSFEKYADLYIGDKKGHPRAYEVVSDRWEVLATYSDTAQFEQVSFVNGINTLRGGKHIEYVSGQVVKKLAEMITSKMKKDVKAQHIRDNLFLFVKCLVVNPSFDTQTKESLTTPASKFGSKCELSDAFIKNLYKCGIVDKAVSLTDFHQDKKLTKTDGKKKNRIFVNKLNDANKAGTKESEKCTLILTEGDSAATMAISGLSVVGRDYYGVFPLRGKFPNVTDMAAKKVVENEEITNIKQIMGLKQGQEYADLSSARYGKIMLLTDADHDGAHIKGLLFNFFRVMWPSLYKRENFLISMLTPIIKVSNVSLGESIKFYSITDFENWQEKRQAEATGMRGWTIKYYKGLGTSSETEAKEYFREFKVVNYKYTGKPSDEQMDLAFNKKRADDRKEVLMRYDRSNILDYTESEVTYDDFVEKELVHYHNRDLERSINHMCDGLKESTRKIWFACKKRRLYKNELKVAQLSAYVAEHSAYHHGEVSLQKALVGMAQDYVGANNIPPLVPNGQFGTRLQGGEDHASARYIFTLVSPVARLVYREEDDPILDYLEDDGQMVEPTYYIPIIPMILVNGGMGIGTGFSTNVPCHNPADVTSQCMLIADAIEKSTSGLHDEAYIAKACQVIDSVRLSKMTPWYLGFKGTITTGKENSFLSHGVYNWVDDTTLEITELPIGTWTEDYKEFLNNMITNGSNVLKDFESHYTAKNVRFILTMYPNSRQALDRVLETEFKLVSSKNLSLNNIHLYSEEGAVRNYKSTDDVVRAWAKVRIEKYVHRKKHQLEQLEKEHAIIAAKVRFINEFIAGTIKLINKTKKEVYAQLKAGKYPVFKAPPKPVVVGEADDDEVVEVEVVGEYDYLTRLSINTLTVEEKRKLEKEEHDIFMKIEALRAKGEHTIWKEELSEFLPQWEAYKTHIESAYEADRMNKAPPAAKRRATKKA
jgi:DNA topoisomerase-2